MVTRLHLFIVITLSILLTSVILTMYTQQRVQDFKEHRLVIEKAMVEGTARDISNRLESQIRHVRLFNDEYRRLISYLTVSPHDEATKEIINIRLRERFPDVESFTITNAVGTPLLDDVETRVGDICKRDISNFVIEDKRLSHSEFEAKNAIFIHPQAGHYHYDIMATVMDGTPNHNVFLVSFNPQPIQDILKSREIPGHQLILSKSNDHALIEISAAGTRDTMGRDGRLTETELLSLKVSKDIPNTDWAMVDLQDPDYEEAYINKLWKESGSIILIVAITNILIFLIFSTRIKYTEIREKKRKNKTYPWIKTRK